MQPLDIELSALFTLAQDGDQNSYEKCIETLYSILEKYYSRRLSNKSVIDDLIQETLLAIHRARHTYDSNYPFLNWARTIAKYKLIDFYKKESKMKNDTDLDDLSASLFILDKKDGDDTLLLEEIFSYMDDLSPSQKEVIKQVKCRGLSIKETAQLSGMSVSNVKTTLHRGIKVLKEKLNQ
jgi:RNA polymerase sigma-70 factor, ECF subfamily